MALDTITNGHHVRFASLFDQDGPALHRWSTITLRPPQPTMQVPLVTGYKPMVTPKSGGPAEVTQNIAMT
jgi:hypothetical protein